MLKIILLFIASLLNLALGLFIILKNYKNKINIYYGLILLGAFFWSLGMCFDSKMRRFNSLLDSAVIKIVTMCGIIFLIFKTINT